MSGERRTLRGNPVVAAPGKLFVIGEYAVLAGAPAVVAAVNRYAVSVPWPRPWRQRCSGAGALSIGDAVAACHAA